MNGFKRLLQKHSFLCCTYEDVRCAWHKIFPVSTPTPVWYKYNEHPSTETTEKMPLNHEWYHINRSLYHREHVYYNLQNALRVNPNVKGFAFVFFMGIGDYLYTTPVWEKLKEQFPHIPFYAYVGAQFDKANSPLVGKVLEDNPYFEKVFYFNGARYPRVWKNYDYSEVFSKAPSDFLIIPVYYEYSVNTSHRVHSLFETFDLSVPQDIPVPKMYFPKEIAPMVRSYLEQAREGARDKKRIVFLQLDSRSSNYTYPYVLELANGLIAQGYYVISVTKGGPVGDSAYLELDIKKLSINQTWQLLSMLKKEYPLYVISVVSVFWAASAGLGLPNLGMQHWVDQKIHNVWYPNIEVITNYMYPLLPRDKQIVAPSGSFTPYNKKMVNYKPEWVIRWFKEKFEH